MRINLRKGAEKSVKGYLAVCLMKMDEYKLMQLTERQQSTRMLVLTLSSSLNKTKKKRKKENWQQPRRESLDPQCAVSLLDRCFCSFFALHCFIFTGSINRSR